MIKFLRDCCWLIPLAIMITTVVCTESYRFKHPDMTDTQLFLELWWAYGILGVSTVATIWVMDVVLKQKPEEECSSYPPDHVNCRCITPKDEK